MSLKHKHIIGIEEAFFSNENEMTLEFNIVTELADGGSLYDQICLKRLENRALQKAFYEICLGLKYMKDNNVIHRDLKTQNILLTKDLTIKIADFGLAKNLSTLSKMASTWCGTPITMAPEVIERKKYTFSADIWSLGCILYEL